MKKLLYILVAGCLLSACVSYKNLYVPDSNYLERRNVETRVFDTTNTKQLLVASAQLLQDMDYTITESDTEIGLITATKDRKVGSAAGKVAITVLAALNGNSKPVYDDKQKFYVTIVTTKAGKHQTKTRVTFARMVYDNYGKVARVEKLDDPALYTEFFDKLAQSVFLTAHNI